MLEAYTDGDDEFSKQCLAFENKLLNHLDSLDDPLEVFLEYINFINESSSQYNKLRSLIERCINYILPFKTYNNDPRFVKIWLYYLDNFISNNISLLQDSFVFMYLNDIGTKLSMFYIEWAHTIYNLPNFNHLAVEILNYGIRQNSRPLNKLKLMLQDLTDNTDNIDNIDNIEWDDVINILTNKYELPNYINQTQNIDSKKIYQINKMEGRLPEKIDCNFNLIYNDTYGELSIEQLLLMMRKPKLNKKRKLSSSPSNKLQIFNDNNNNTIEYKTHTSILPLKTEQDNNIDNNNTITNTITFFSKDAMNEVYSMFNQNFNENSTQNTDNNTTTTNILNKFNNTDTQDLTRQNIDDLTEVKTKPLITRDTSTDNIANTHDNLANTHDSKRGMFDIEEKTENSIHTPSKSSQIHTPLKSSQFLQSQSSPFISQPFLSQPFASQSKVNQSKNNTQLPLIISHPLSNNLRQLLLSKLNPPLSTYDSFYQYDQDLNMCNQLEKIHKLTKSSNKKLPIINFTKINKFYCIYSELGRGGFAIVYLAESDSGSLNALKVEKPANSWEYYILKQIELRLQNEPILNSIINANSLHFFQDESYLVLNYANQGTILDLINLYYNNEFNDQSTIDELVCMFITIELIKIIEKIHDIGIIHGDLKPDNCMIRLLPLDTDNNEQLGDYNKYGNNGWNSKGIYLIDFGRSFDLTLFQQNTQFKADWITDEQDCYEMREGLPWSYECDYYGLAGIIHCMLFGTFIKTVMDPQNHILKLKQPLKRSWQREIWSELFNLLLNSGNYNLPITSTIKPIRLKMEDYILNDRRNSNKLRSLVLNLENELSQVKDKYYIPKRG